MSIAPGAPNRLLEALPVFHPSPSRRSSSARRLAGTCVAVSIVGATLFVSAAGADPKPGSSGRSGAPTATRTPTPTKRPAVAKPKAAATKRGSASGLGSGARGPAVLEVQTLLQAARYDINVADGAFGDQTFHAVMAFQKANGLARTGRVGSQTLDALRAGVTPAPIVPDGGPDRIEVSLPKQYLALYRGGELVRILSISSGNGKPFCTLDPETGEQACDTAITPPGSFRISRRVIGWRESKLGLLYNPLYFNGGIAVHGAPSVPGSPASHGCVRIPMVSADFIPTVAPNGMPVYVSDGATPLRVISSRIAPADAWPGTLPASTAPSTTVLPGTPTTTGPAGVPTTTVAPTATTIVGATTIPAATLPGATTIPGATTTIAPTTVAPTTTLPAPTTTIAPTLARPLVTTTVAPPV